MGRFSGKKVLITGGTRKIHPVSSQMLCHVLAGAAATWSSWSSAQHNRSQTA